jgi:UPF0176 protein
MDNKVLLYYNFTPLTEVPAFIEAHKTRCKELNLLGRIYVSEEGINGTVSGTIADCDAYKDYVWSLDGLSSTAFKEDLCDHVPFGRLICKYRAEIVALHTDMELNPKDGGRYLSPREWREALETEKDYVLIDVRNNYESKIGHFEGAILPDLENFYDFPNWVDEADIPKDKKILMYCTGGIRCEKFSVLMKKKGYADVSQLHGGILTYAKEEGGAHYHGKCFVFDDRLAVPVNPNEEEPVSVCELSGQPADTYINCANMDCNKLFVCCEGAADKYQGCCSEACMHAPRLRPFNKEAAFAPFRRAHHYFK